MFKSTKVERPIARAVVAFFFRGAVRAGLGDVRWGACHSCTPGARDRDPVQVASPGPPGRDRLSDRL